jgi:hypothetical protein
MTKKIDHELRQLLQQMASAAPESRVPLVITLKKGVRAADLLPCEIDHEFPVISAVSCKMTPQQALDLAAQPSVERVEYDGEFYALRDKVPGGAR